MDLGQLLAAAGGNGGGTDLSEALTATTPAGDLLFQRPFGDSTVWRVKPRAASDNFNAEVRVSVIFDPFLPWSRSNRLASTTGDVFGDMRRELCKLLCPDKLAPTKATREELHWERIRARLPDRAFAAYLAQDAQRLEKYLGVLRHGVDEQLDEDEALIAALTTREFQFAYHLAIDAYPQKQKDGGGDARDGPSRLLRRSASDSGAPGDDGKRREKLGVLVISIEGRPRAGAASGDDGDDDDGDDAGAGAEAAGGAGADGGDDDKGELAEDGCRKVGIDCAPSEPPTGETPPPSPPLRPSSAAGGSGGARRAEPTLRKHRTPKNRRAQRELEELLDTLDMSAEKLAQGHNVWAKEVPETAVEFFEEASAWFAATLQRKQAQLTEKMEGRSASLYR